MKKRQRPARRNASGKAKAIATVSENRVGDDGLILDLQSIARKLVAEPNALSLGERTVAATYLRGIARDEDLRPYTTIRHRLKKPDLLKDDAALVYHARVYLGEKPGRKLMASVATLNPALSISKVDHAQRAYPNAFEQLGRAGFRKTRSLEKCAVERLKGPLRGK